MNDSTSNNNGEKNALAEATERRKRTKTKSVDSEMSVERERERATERRNDCKIWMQTTSRLPIMILTLDCRRWLNAKQMWSATAFRVLCTRFMSKRTHAFITSMLFYRFAMIAAPATTMSTKTTKNDATNDAQTLVCVAYILRFVPSSKMRGFLYFDQAWSETSDDVDSNVDVKLSKSCNELRQQRHTFTHSHRGDRLSVELKRTSRTTAKGKRE